MSRPEFKYFADHTASAASAINASVFPEHRVGGNSDHQYKQHTEKSGRRNGCRFDSSENRKYEKQQRCSEHSTPAGVFEACPVADPEVKKNKSRADRQNGGPR